MITSKIDESFLGPSYQTHFNFLEGQLKTSPGGGSYLCGREVTEADIMMIFPIEASKSWASLTPSRFPRQISAGNQSSVRAPPDEFLVEGFQLRDGPWRLLGIEACRAEQLFVPDQRQAPSGARQSP